ncbi:hypothetical protein [Mucilaginibacter sp. 3215]|uniref:hypothetical protein n=1 Tax=Mucilaginibacter sp. 3215 TaxID=3373912 RepID=UPI003D259E2C
MFGLVLIVFSFYFRDTQLNEFDKNQIKYRIRITDSLRSNLIVSRNNDSVVMAQINKELSFKDSVKQHNIVFIKQSLSKLPPHNFGDRDTVAQNIYKKLLSESDLNIDDNNNYILTLQYFRTQFFAFKSYKRRLEDDLNFYKRQEARNENYFSSLMWVGIILFLTGATLWYFMIQKPQDELLKMQISEAKRKIKA